MRLLCRLVVNNADLPLPSVVGVSTSVIAKWFAIVQGRGKIKQSIRNFQTANIAYLSSLLNFNKTSRPALQDGSFKEVGPPV